MYIYTIQYFDDSNELIPALNKLGSEDWELVTCEYIKSFKYTYNDILEMNVCSPDNKHKCVLKKKV